MTADPTAETTPWSQAWTLAAPLRFAGVGLHSGVEASVSVSPAPASQGLRFVRTDRPGAPGFAARAGLVGNTRLCTELGEGDTRVRTVEHLLAALHGLGISSATIALDGPEVPLLDGSARPFVEAILAVGVTVLESPRVLIPLAAGGFREADKIIATLPGPGRHLTYGVDYGHPFAGAQVFQAELTPALFASAIAGARTFGFAHEIAALRAAGLALGGTLESAVVIDECGYSTPLRFPDEFVRHKVLDLIGDLALAGGFWQGQLVVIKGGHALHNQLARALEAGASRPVGAPPRAEVSP